MPRLESAGGHIDFGQNGANPTDWSTQGNFAVGGTLAVTGATSTGALTPASLAVTAGATVGTTLAVTGATTGPSVDSIAGALTVGATNATAINIGKASAVAGTGVAIAASRVTGSKPTAPVDIAGGITATVAQILEAGIFLCSASATLTLPTMQGAAGLVQALPGTPAVGTTFEFTQVVAAAQTATLAVGTGATLGGIATTAAAATGRRWIGRVTAVTANSETVTFY